MTQGSQKTTDAHRLGSSTGSQARATPKLVSRGGPNLGLASGGVHKPKSTFQPFRVPEKGVHRLVVYSYIPRPRYPGPPLEGTIRHWALLLTAEARGDGRGLLHDIAGRPRAFYHRRLRDVRPSELGDDITKLPAGNIHDVAAYNETVSTTRILNDALDFNSQHWVHEAMERLHDRGLLYDVVWDALECNMIRSLEGTP